MRYTIYIVAALFWAIGAGAQAQTTEYTRKITGSLELSAIGEVTTYNVQSAGVPAIDQQVGNLVSGWRFEPYPGQGKKPAVIDFVMTLVRSNLEEKAAQIKRVEFMPQNPRSLIRGAGTPDELAYCQQADAAPRKDVICPATLPRDAALDALAVSAEVYVAIRSTENGPQVELENLALYGTLNNKMLNKATSIARPRYSEVALAWARKNAAALLQDREYFMTRVEYVQAENKLVWRRQENQPLPKIDWLTDAVRSQTMYVVQGGLQLK
jgi:hypothetical protein